MRGLLLGATIAVAAGMVLPLLRVVLGPTHFDRLTGLGLIGSKTILLLIAVGALTGSLESLVDIALGYAMVSFIGTLALAKYFERGGPYSP